MLKIANRELQNGSIRGVIVRGAGLRHCQDFGRDPKLHWCSYIFSESWKRKRCMHAYMHA